MKKSNLIGQLISDLLDDQHDSFRLDKIYSTTFAIFRTDLKGGDSYTWFLASDLVLLGTMLALIFWTKR